VNAPNDFQAVLHQQPAVSSGTHLHARIVATLETGMRRGEILGVQWEHIRTSIGVIDLPATVTKTSVGRQVIITPNLKATLEMLAAAQRAALELEDDEGLPLSLHPFGNEIGEKVKSFKTAWKLTCKRAGIAGLRFRAAIDKRDLARTNLAQPPQPPKSPTEPTTVTH
jgi:integrase